MAESIELSVEETNKLRAQLGLPLIPTSETSEKPENTQKRNRAENSGLGGFQGSNLSQIGDVSANHNSHSASSRHAFDDAENVAPVGENTRKKSEIGLNVDKKPKKILFTYDDVDTDSWLENLGESRASQAPPVQEEDGMYDIDPENEAHTTVKHSTTRLAQIADGEVFTLADSGVLDEKDDELENEALKRETKLARDQKERQKEGFLKFGKPRITDQNDDDSEADEPESVALEGGSILLTQDKSKMAKDSSTPAGQTAVFEDLFDVADRPKPEIKMKKIKTKKIRNSAKKRTRDDEITDSGGPMYTTKLDAEEEAEDEFEEALNRARTKKIKTRRNLTAEEIAEEVRSHTRVDMATQIESGLVYDDTKDFLDSIGVVSEQHSTGAGKEIEGFTPNDSKDTRTVWEETSVHPSDSTDTSNQQKSEILEKNKGEVDVNVPETKVSQKDHVSDHIQEPNLSSLSSTLKYLRSQSGTVDSGSKRSKSERERQKEAELAKIQIKIEERIVREEMAQDDAFSRMNKEEQEKIVDRRLNERLVEKGIVAETRKSGRYARYNGPADPLQDYNPQVNVQYTDSRGNQLDTKQAWKELSHRYHGSAPKHKKERVTRKTTEEKVIH
ncbi:hypothetical protein OY671_005450 [Metschnikowia pulcherrima]|nr:hypothetical protein OY671_005450 [Metschnikowia pulcherrima]